MRPGKTSERVALPFDVANSGRWSIRVIGNLIVVPPKRCHETELVVGVPIVDERPHASKSPHPIVEYIRTGSFQTVVAPIAIDTSEIGELFAVAAEVHLIVGLMKRAESSKQLRFIVSFKPRSRDNVENAVS